MGAGAARSLPDRTPPPMDLLQTSVLALLLALAAAAEEQVPERFLPPRDFNPHPFERGERERVHSAPTHAGEVVGPVGEILEPHPYVLLARKRPREGRYPHHRPGDPVLYPHPTSVLNELHRSAARAKIHQQSQEQKIQQAQQQQASGDVFYSVEKPGLSLHQHQPVLLYEQQEPSQHLHLEDPHHNSAENYAFSYSVRDTGSGDDFAHAQARSGGGTRGEYRVRLPDGRLQIVSYVADNHGYRADVRYDESLGEQAGPHHQQNPSIHYQQQQQDEAHYQQQQQPMERPAHQYVQASPSPVSLSIAQQFVQASPSPAPVPVAHQYAQASPSPTPLSVTHHYVQASPSPASLPVAQQYSASGPVTHNYVQASPSPSPAVPVAHQYVQATGSPTAGPLAHQYVRASPSPSPVPVAHQYVKAAASPTAGPLAHQFVHVSPNPAAAPLAHHQIVQAPSHNENQAPIPHQFVQHPPTDPHALQHAQYLQQYVTASPQYLDEAQYYEQDDGFYVTPTAPTLSAVSGLSRNADHLNPSNFLVQQPTTVPPPVDNTASPAPVQFPRVPDDNNQSGTTPAPKRLSLSSTRISEGILLHRRYS